MTELVGRIDGALDARDRLADVAVAVAGDAIAIGSTSASAAKIAGFTLDADQGIALAALILAAVDKLGGRVGQ